jgi:hypothetical protein
LDKVWSTESHVIRLRDRAGEEQSVAMVLVLVDDEEREGEQVVL